MHNSDTSATTPMHKSLVSSGDGDIAFSLTESQEKTKGKGQGGGAGQCADRILQSTRDSMTKNQNACRGKYA